MHEFLLIFTKITFTYVHRDNNIVTACAQLEDTSTKSCTTWHSRSVKCVQNTHMRRKPHSERVSFSSLTEGSGLPCHWSSVDIERRRPQKAQRDSPAVFLRFPWKGACFLLSLPACQAAHDSLCTFHWKWLVSHWSSLTMWDGFKGGESVLHSAFACQLNTKSRFLILQWSVHWEQHVFVKMT